MSRIEQKLQTRQKIVDAAGRTFRKSGFNGAGVDGLAKAAGVTSGAFYVHFASKADAFYEAIESGMLELKTGVLHSQDHFGEAWWREFVRFYLKEKRCCDLAEGCALQALVSEVTRSDDASRKIFESAFETVSKVIIDGPASRGKPENLSQAYVALASLVGGVTLARAMSDPKAAEQIAMAIERQLVPQ